MFFDFCLILCSFLTIILQCSSNKISNNKFDDNKDQLQNDIEKKQNKSDTYRKGPKKGPSNESSGELKKSKNRKVKRQKSNILLSNNSKPQLKEIPKKNGTSSPKLFTTEGFEYRNLRTQQQRELMNKNEKSNYNVPSIGKLIDTMNMLNEDEQKESFAMKKQKSFPSICDVISSDGTNKSKKSNIKKMTSNKKRQKTSNKKLNKTDNKSNCIVNGNLSKSKNNKYSQYLALSKTQGLDDSLCKKESKKIINNNKNDTRAESPTQITDAEKQERKDKTKDVETLKTPVIPRTLDKTNNSTINTQEEH
uniref:Uncharacterized protein n=1 Tax=Strongyloides stercoralis TaxID=6248 RepID=A0A0K0DV67_STRER